MGQLRPTYTAETGRFGVRHIFSLVKPRMER